MRLRVLMALGVLTVSLASADVMVGTADPGTGNCMPFSCPGQSFITDYQQLYASSDFSGPTTITGLTFFNTQFSGGTLSAGTFTLRLSTVSATVGTFSSIIAVGADNTQIFSGSLGSLPFGGSMTLGGGSFNYNPANGSLLLDVLISGGSNHNGQYLDAMNGDAGGLFSRAVNGSITGTVGWGLVTRFNTSTSPVPEPSSLLLFGTILLGAAAAAKRKLIP